MTMRKYSILATIGVVLTLLVSSCNTDEFEVYTSESVLESLDTNSDTSMVDFILILEEENAAWYPSEVCYLYSDGSVWATYLDNEYLMFNVRLTGCSMTTYNNGEYRYIECNDTEDREVSNYHTASGVPADGSQFGDCAYYYYNGLYEYDLDEKTIMTTLNSSLSIASTYYFMGCTSDGGYILKMISGDTEVYTKYLKIEIPEYFSNAKQYIPEYYTDWIEYIEKYDTTLLDGIQDAYTRMYAEADSIDKIEGLFDFYMIVQEYNEKWGTDFKAPKNIY